MKNIHITTADVARKYNISDTSVHYIFLQYLNIKRLPLPEIISVDEVFLDIDYKHRYALVIMDFDSSEIIDILPNRWEETTNAYFYLFHWKNEKTLNTLSVTCTIPISTIRSVTFLTVLPSLIVFTLFLGS